MIRKANDLEKENIKLLQEISERSKKHIGNNDYDEEELN